MVVDAPYIEQIMQSVDAFIGERAPIVAHNLQFEYKFLAANGSENIAKSVPFMTRWSCPSGSGSWKATHFENVCRNTFQIYASTA